MMKSRGKVALLVTVMIWKNLQKELIPKLSQDAKKKLSKRIEQAMTPAHFLSNIVNLKYRGKDITDNEIEIGMDFAASKNQDFLPLLVNFKAEVAPFQKFMFSDNIVQTIKLCDWWKSLKDRVNQGLLEVVDQLLTSVASSTEVERIFSSLSLVHSNIKNRKWESKQIGFPIQTI